MVWARHGETIAEKTNANGKTRMFVCPPTGNPNNSRTMQKLHDG